MKLEIVHYLFKKPYMKVTFVQTKTISATNNKWSWALYDKIDIIKTGTSNRFSIREAKKIIKEHYKPF